MAASLEWTIPYLLTTPAGSLAFNTDDVLGSAADGGILLLDDSSIMRAPLRPSLDDVPASDGAIPHPALTSGYRVTLVFRLFQTREEPACDEVLVLLNDLVMKHVNALRSSGGGRLVWNPSGLRPERMVDDLWWFDDLIPEKDGAVWKITVGFVSAFPYAEDNAETTTTITDGGSSILTNDGSAPFFPVMKVYGPTSFFEIVNADSLDSNGDPRRFVYDAALPGAVAIGGGGDYVEFDFFRNTAYLNGSGANRKPGIDVLESDFFPLEIGSNEISIDGADVTVLWQDAWV